MVMAQLTGSGAVIGADSIYERVVKFKDNEKHLY